MSLDLAPSGEASAGETWVVKIGGAAVDEPAVARNLLQQVGRCVAAGHRLVLVHGGGKRLTAVAARLGLASSFVGGRRITDDGMIEAAKLVFAGGVGSDLAAQAHAARVRAVALSGVSGGLVQVTKRPPVDGVDYGWVGDVVGVDPGVLQALLSHACVPLVASLGVDALGQIYNINADTVACALATALKAHRLVILTELNGVLRDVGDPTSNVPRLRAGDILAGSTGLHITGGMLPKLASLTQVLASGVGQVQIASWHQDDVLTALMHRGGAAGTVITN